MSVVAPERDEAEMPEAGRLNSPSSRTEVTPTEFVDRYVSFGNVILELDKPLYEFGVASMSACTYEVNGHAIGEPHWLVPTRNEQIVQGRFVVMMGNRILCVTDEGVVWGRDFRPSGQMLPPFRLDGPPVAHNPDDHFVVTVGLWIVVITNDGAVWGHATDVIDNTLRDAIRFDGPPVASNPGDQFVLTMGTRILVITNDGQVWGHEVSVIPPTIGAPVRLDGPAVAANPGDQFVMTIGNRIVVITDQGRVWGHEVNDTTIGQPFKFVS